MSSPFSQFHSHCNNWLSFFFFFNHSFILVSMEAVSQYHMYQHGFQPGRSSEFEKKKSLKHLIVDLPIYSLLFFILSFFSVKRSYLSRFQQVLTGFLKQLSVKSLLSSVMTILITIKQPLFVLVFSSIQRWLQIYMAYFNTEVGISQLQWFSFFSTVQCIKFFIQE